MVHATLPEDPVHINYSEWVRLAYGLPSNNLFVEGAVDLVWEIARCLCRTRLVWSAGIRLENCFTSDNVIIYVDRPLPELSAVAQATSIPGIQFQIEVSSGSSSSPPGAFSCTRSLCGSAQCWSRRPPTTSS